MLAIPRQKSNSKQREDLMWFGSNLATFTERELERGLLINLIQRDQPSS